jgi:sugar lactone lactonase YvrE
LFNGLPSHGGDLTVGPNGNFYGLYGIYGVSGEGVFEVHVDGSNLQLFPFYTTVDGAGAPDGLLLASDGNFWMAVSTGSSGGNTSYGDIIALSPADGTLIKTIRPFNAAGTLGAFPEMLMQAEDGTLWGTTDQYGKAPTGQFGDGTVFSLNAGLPPK